MRLTQWIEGYLCIDNTKQDDIINKLAAYEDIGLSPEEIKLNMDGLDEYHKAEAEGRLVILPCKVGERVYKACKTWCTMPICTTCIEYGSMKCCDYLSENKCTSKIEKGSDGATYAVVSLMFDYSMIPEIGKTVFLTREEAEAALKVIK